MGRGLHCASSQPSCWPCWRFVELHTNFSGRGIFLALMAPSLITTAWFARVHSGSYLNALMPAHAAMAILFGFSIQTLRNAMIVLAPRWVCYFLAVVQLALFSYDPRTSVPTRGDREAGYTLLEVIEGFDGEVYLPFHGHLPRLAGKEPLAHAAAIDELMRAGAGPEKATLTNEIMQALEQTRFDALILDVWWHRQMLNRYTLRSRLLDDETVFWPVTGKRTRPELILTPEGESPGRGVRAPTRSSR